MCIFNRCIIVTYAELVYIDTIFRVGKYYSTCVE